MKKLFAGLLITMTMILGTTFVTDASAATKTLGLTWDANTEVDLKGYRLYRGTKVGGPYVRVGEVLAPIVTFTDTLPAAGFYTFVATAFDSVGNESGYSNEVTFSYDDVAPGAPKLLRLVP